MDAEAEAAPAAEAEARDPEKAEARDPEKAEEMGDPMNVTAAYPMPEGAHFSE